MTQGAVQQAFEKAIEHQRAGRVREAETVYRQIVTEHPDHAGAIYNLGMISRRAGRNDLAVQLLRQAIAANPNFAEAYNNLGNALKDLGQVDAAIAAYRKGISLGPKLAEIPNNLGNALKMKGLVDDAMAQYRKAIALKADYAEAHFNLGISFQTKGQSDEAIASYRRAVSHNSKFAEAFNNLGNALRSKGELEEAAAAYREAIKVRPNFAEAHSNLGSTFKEEGRLDDAISSYREAIARNSEYADAHVKLAQTLLLRGEFEAGWPEWEWRLKLDNSASPDREFPELRWDGGDLAGRTILIYGESGLGDTIQFSRYLPMVAERGGRVIAQAPKELIGFLGQVPGVEQWVAAGEKPPAFDVQCPLLSLPGLLDTNLQNIPGQQSLLKADEKLAEGWRNKTFQQPGGVKVGLVWAGSRKNKNDRNRSVNLDVLAPLAAISGIRFYSLQKGDAAKDAQKPPEGMEIVDWTDELRDFADTAALVGNLDLIISVDTSVAHLAGAMGKPVWILLPFLPDWRWMVDREESPWYPTARLFRQTTRGDWADVVARVGEALAEWASDHRLFIGF